MKATHMKNYNNNYIRRENRQKRKAQQLKQVLVFKLLCLICFIGGLIVPFIDPAEGSAAVILVCIGLFGLVAPFDAFITW